MKISKVTKVSKVIEEYMDSRRFSSLSESSKRQYVYAMERIDVAFGDLEIEGVRRRDIMKLHDSLSDRPSTANSVMRVASIFFNFAMDMEYIHANPATRITPMKIGTLKRWEVDQINKVISLGHRRISTAVALAYYTGQREADVLKMKWSDIKDNCLHVKQSKTGQVLEILIAKELRNVLDGIDRDGDYIVGGGSAVSGPSFRNQFTRVIRKIGLDLPFHGIRKTVGCILAEKGSSVNEIAAMLGHKTLAMAALYTRQANSTKMIASAVTSLTSD